MGWQWRKTKREREEPRCSADLDAVLRLSRWRRGRLAAEDASSVLEGQHWAAHETPLSCQVEAGAARPGVQQRGLGQRQVSTLVTGATMGGDGTDQGAIRRKKGRTRAKGKATETQRIEAFMQSQPKGQKTPQSLLNLDPMQEIVCESRQRALSPVTCVCILIPALKFTCLWVHYLASLTLAVTRGGVRCHAVLTSFSRCPACRRSSAVHVERGVDRHKAADAAHTWRGGPL